MEIIKQRKFNNKIDVYVGKYIFIKINNIHIITFYYSFYL